MGVSKPTSDVLQFITYGYSVQMWLCMTQPMYCCFLVTCRISTVFVQYRFNIFTATTWRVKLSPASCKVFCDLMSTGLVVTQVFKYRETFLKILLKLLKS
uniref:Uncharacterized protein n=1 Tax=Schizaphis graminum TaxID=13262 RepID=A0A2S2PLM3_SCHGA